MDDVVIGASPPPSTDEAEPGEAEVPAAAEAVEEKELLCPICMQIPKDAFLTACGHSFCYMCIVTHLRNKSDCPCCAQFLTTSQLFPNFLLDKLLKKMFAREHSKTASPVEQFRQSLEKGCEVSAKELGSLLSLVAEKKRKMEQEEAERNLQILLDFLHNLRRKKIDDLNEMQNDLLYIKEDLTAVERRKMYLNRARERCSIKVNVLSDDPLGTRPHTSLVGRSTPGFLYNSSSAPGGITSYKKNEGNFQITPHGTQSKGGGLTSQHVGDLSVIRKKRVHAQFNELQEFYLQRRRQSVNHLGNHEKKDKTMVTREGYSSGLEDFKSVLSTFTRYSRLRVIAELRHGDLFHSANIVSSIEFNCDDELFATAGVSRRIEVFDFSSVVNEPKDANPVVEMATRSKLSYLSWNRFMKSHIASSDYEGIVTVWDVSTQQSIMEYEEHEKRAWSVDFSRTDPSMLVSGSDDCKVKVWCTKQEASVLNIDMKANICSVKYNPESSNYIAVGSADHHIHYYDLRNTHHPLHVFSGHKKTVSYVKFLSENELASASTDSTLRLWDVKQNTHVRTFKGHTNEKNFVGFTVNNEFLACGSETNDVFVYHKAISKPATWHKFGSPEAEDTEEDAISYFISAICWKSDSPTMLAANSKGTIKVMVLAP
ncbi:E3 ubiquitin-protein ligase COP1 [Striga hermonthica]|uniref:E3 ubiquitin-protein ligase COP1 n=1 Tax=Striga hermonthica TaxID=68872 RepID=A0A9N7NU69_STRHE|nr:E3 ubiquitin-protein ligase COP1 [Striga hermonthica]